MFACLSTGKTRYGRSALLFEPAHDKTNKVTCVPSKDSDQPGHPTSLIRVFTLRIEKQIRVFDGRTLIFCWFCHEAAHFIPAPPPHPGTKTHV